MMGGRDVDDVIIQQVLAGNTDAFDQLIEKYYNELFVFIHNQVNNVETTRDILQEVFMRLYQKLGKYNPKKASFRTWMYRVTGNYTISYLRQMKFYIHDYNMDLLPSSDNIVETLIQQEDVRNIISVMKDQLNKRHYQIMMLHFFSSLDDEEIASTYGITKKTVQNTISLSIKKIKDTMGGEST
jgi:RNA polymerase sigma-70 factor (ECF subfamily)